MKTPTQTAEILGYAGLIPFVALSAFQLIQPLSPHQEVLLLSLMAYSATIVSFLGAIHWGFAMQQEASDRTLFLWGVLPSLSGWISLIIGVTNGLLLLVVTLWLCFFVDYKIYPKLELAKWLLMRFVLTSVASLSLILVLLFKP